MKKTKESVRWQQAPTYLALAVLVLTVMTVATTPLALGKYVASVTVNTSARVAKFSFVTKTDTYVNQGGEEEIAVTAGEATPFTIPLFDISYVGYDSKNTVLSSDGALVIAPGTGHHGRAYFSGGNPNYGQFGDPNCIWVNFKNNSEVSVRFKVEYDNASTTQGIPFLMRNNSSDSKYDGKNTNPGGWVRLDLAASDPKPLMTGGTDGWVTLAPGADHDLGLTWTWVFGHTEDAAPANGLTWANWAIGAGDAPAPYANNNQCDTFDTALGKAGGAIEFKFLLTVEQIN